MKNERKTELIWNVRKKESDGQREKQRKKEKNSHPPSPSSLLHSGRNYVIIYRFVISPSSLHHFYFTP